MRYPAMNRALRGGLGRMGDTSSDNQVSDNDPNDLSGSLSFDSCDLITGACTNAGNVLTSAQSAALTAANIAANTYTMPTATATTAMTATNWTTYAVIGAGLLMFAYLAKGK